MNEAKIVDKILRQIAATDFSVTAVPDQPISLFETTIRYLGGLLSGIVCFSSVPCECVVPRCSCWVD